MIVYHKTTADNLHLQPPLPVSGRKPAQFISLAFLKPLVTAPLKQSTCCCRIYEGKDHIVFTDMKVENKK